MDTEGYQNCFNLFNRQAARTQSSSSTRPKPSKPEKQTVELYFMNPNLLFLSQNDIRPRAPSGQKPKTSYAEERKVVSRDSCRRMDPALHKRRLNSYIKMEKVFMNFRKTGNFHL